MKPKNEADKSAEVPFWTSHRFVLALVVFYCNIVLYAVRFNISVAIVCMTVPTNVTDEISSETGPTECMTSSNGSSSSAYQGGEFKWSKSLQGFILSSFYYGYILAQVPTAWLTQRYGPKFVTMFSLSLQGVTTALAPVVANIQPDTIGPYLLLAMRVTLGAASGSCVTSTTAIWGRWAPPYERTKLVGFCFTGNVLGTVIILPLSGYLCEQGFGGGWPSIFYVSGILNFIACILWWGLVHDTPEAHPRISDAEREYITSSIGNRVDHQLSLNIPWRKMFTCMPVYAIMVGGFASGYGVYTISTNLPMYMEEVLRFDIKTNGFLSSLPFLVEAISSVLFSHLADVLRVRTRLTTTHVRKIFQCLANIGPAVLIVIMGFITCDNRGVAVVLVSAACALQAGIRAGFLVNAVDLAPRYAGAVFAITNSAGTVSGTVGPLVASVLTPNGSRAEWQLVFYIIAGVLSCGAVFYGIFGSGEVQEWAKDPDDSTEKSRDKPYIYSEVPVVEYDEKKAPETESCL